ILAVMMYRSKATQKLNNIAYARNYGAAFSFLADSGGWQRWFFGGVSCGISVILAVMMYRSKATQKLNNIAYARNYGAAFSFLADSGGWQRWFF
ncbi:signal peptidase II, partial [Escherichia coli]|uniref:signal peptidase II n=1 Tax=Escherichia coli TaxID=562 RepID=UPI003B58779F